MSSSWKHQSASVNQQHETYTLHHVSSVTSVPVRNGGVAHCNHRYHRQHAYSSQQLPAHPSAFKQKEQNNVQLEQQTIIPVAQQQQQQQNVSRTPRPTISLANRKNSKDFKQQLLAADVNNNNNNNTLDCFAESKDDKNDIQQTVVRVESTKSTTDNSTARVGVNDPTGLKPCTPPLPGWTDGRRLTAYDSGLKGSGNDEDARENEEEDDDDGFEDALGYQSINSNDSSTCSGSSSRASVASGGVESLVISTSSENNEDEGKTEAWNPDSEISCKTIDSSSAVKKNPPIIIKDIPARFKKLLKAAADKATAQRLRVEGIPLIRQYPQTTVASTGAGGYLLPQEPTGSLPRPAFAPSYPMVAAPQPMFASPQGYQAVSPQFEISGRIQKPSNAARNSQATDVHNGFPSQADASAQAFGCCYVNPTTSQPDAHVVPTNPCVPVAVPTPYGPVAYIITPAHPYHVVYSSEGTADVNSNANYYCAYNSNGLYVNQQLQQQSQQFLQQQQQQQPVVYQEHCTAMDGNSYSSALAY